MVKKKCKKKGAYDGNLAPTSARIRGLVDCATFATKIGCNHREECSSLFQTSYRPVYFEVGSAISHATHGKNFELSRKSRIKYLRNTGFRKLFREFVSSAKSKPGRNRDGRSALICDGIICSTRTGRGVLNSCSSAWRLPAS